MNVLRTTSLACLGLAASTSITLADVEYEETLVHDTTTRVDIALTDETVLCSDADYGAKFLKVLIPELASLTLLDHQNLGAGAPCVAAGACGPDRMPADVLDGHGPTEAVDIRVQAIRLDTIDTAAQTCHTSLTERVTVDIRGFAFMHERWADLGPRPFSDCGQPAVSQPQQPQQPPPPTDDDKNDYGGAPQVEQGGGCSSSGGSAGGSLAFALAMVGVARRRRRRA